MGCGGQCKEDCASCKSTHSTPRPAQKALISRKDGSTRTTQSSHSASPAQPLQTLQGANLTRMGAAPRGADSARRGATAGQSAARSTTASAGLLFPASSSLISPSSANQASRSSAVLRPIGETLSAKGSIRPPLTAEGKVLSAVMSPKSAGQSASERVKQSGTTNAILRTPQRTISVPAALEPFFLSQLAKGLTFDEITAKVQAAAQGSAQDSSSGKISGAPIRTKGAQIRSSGAKRLKAGESAGVFPPKSGGSKLGAGSGLIKAKGRGLRGTKVSGPGSVADPNDVDVVPKDNLPEEKERVIGRRCYPSLRDAPEEIDGCVTYDIGTIRQDKVSFFLSGDAVKGLEVLDDLIMRYMRNNCFPNGAVSVVSADGRLVYCKAFTNCGLLQEDKEEIFRADVHSLFRVGSVSKIITTIAVMAAAEDGALDEKGGFELKIGPNGGLRREYLRLRSFAYKFVDLSISLDGEEHFYGVPELKNITLHHLLTHSAGWVEGGREGGREVYPPNILPDWAIYSPDFNPGKNDFALASVFGSTPVTKDEIIYFMNFVPLTWDPATIPPYGTGTPLRAYSNYGFMLLASILESATGYSYESYVKARVWSRLGTCDSCIGDLELSKRKMNEVKYYSDYFPDESNRLTGRGYRPNVMARYDAWPLDPECGWRGDNVPCELHTYAHLNMRNADGGGGWLSSVYDLSLLMKDIFTDRNTSKVLKKESIDDMLTPWLLRDSSDWQCYGWEEGKNEIGTYSKTGGMEGSAAMVFNFGTIDQGMCRGASVVYLFNREIKGPTVDLLSEIEKLLKITGNSGWRTAGDLFGKL